MKAAMWLLVATVVVLSAALLMRRRPAPLIPPDVQRELDSLRETRQRAEQTIDSLRTSAAEATARATTATGRAYRAEAVAHQHRGTADSLARDAAASGRRDQPMAQQVLLWRTAYDARSAEAESLRASGAQKDTALEELRTAVDRLQQALAASEARRQRSEALNDQLAEALQRAQRGCRIVGPIPCPSRTVTGVVAFAAGVGAGFAAH